MVPRVGLLLRLNFLESTKRTRLLEGGQLARVLDGYLSRYESSQNFNLVDVGALFFAGPLGLVLTKGYSFASLLQESGTGSEIRTLVSEWKVERGVAHAQDVAMATKANRIALQGGLNFVDDRFDEVTLAVIDAKGCAKVKQKVHGTFQNPVVDEPNVFATLAGPALSLLEKGRDLVRGHCDVFYAGSVVTDMMGHGSGSLADDDHDAGTVLDAAQTTDGLRNVRWRTECGQRAGLGSSRSALLHRRPGGIA